MADTLRLTDLLKLLNITNLIAATLEHWRQQQLADGYPTTTLGNGSSGGTKGGISDPTAIAATQRAPITQRTTTALRSLRHATDLTISLWEAVTLRRISHDLTALRADDLCQVLRARLTDIRREWHTPETDEHGLRILPHPNTCRTVVIVDQHETITITPAECVALISTHLDHAATELRIRLDLTRDKNALRCTGGGAAEWSRPDCRDNAVHPETGLCHACYQRMRRHETRADA
jgi:hypothetical protein